MEEQNLHSELFGEETESGVPVYPVKRLQRAADNSIIAGVCSGIAEYTRKDAATIRVITMMMLLLGAWIVAAYLTIAFLLPIGKHDESLTDEKIKAISKENFKTVLSGLFIVVGLHYAFAKLGLTGSSGILILPNSFMFPLLAIAAGVFLLMNKMSKPIPVSQEPKEFYRTRTDKFFLGVCGGTAKYLGIDSSSLRIIFLLLTGLTMGMFAAVYLIIAFTTKQEPQLPSLTNE